MTEVDPVVSEILGRINLANKPIDLDQWADAEEGIHIKAASDYTEAVIESRFNPDTSKKYYLPWPATREEMEVRPGELSIWAGKRGSGKSMITGQVIASLLDQGQKAVIASMEMPIPVTLDRMMTQVLRTDNPTETAARDFFQWTDGKLFMYQQEGTVPARRVLGLARYAAVEMKVENVVIDSLMMIGVDAKGNFEKMEAQGQFVRDLAMIARDTGCHIHLVCHLRKSESGANSRSDADDVKGAGEITDLASVVYILSVNRKKREESKKQIKDAKVMEQADVFLSIEKNRNGPSGAVFGLRSLKNMQFVTNSTNKSLGLVRKFTL